MQVQCLVSENRGHHRRRELEEWLAQFQDTHQIRTAKRSRVSHDDLGTTDLQVSRILVFH